MLAKKFSRFNLGINSNLLGSKDLFMNVRSIHSGLNLHKSKKLREMLQNGSTDFLMEAHSGLSARIVEEAGFKGIWASGLSISAALGVRDNNEASWTQVLDVVEFMSDKTTIPILFDGDTGFGNFNNARRLVSKLEQRGVAGVCIEDKLFPKTNSFLGESQPLADMDEFCGKIRAMKDIQKNPDFCVVARLESFISGWPLAEALRRAEAYHKAGADAILVHSKKSNSEDIDNFMSEWANRAPVVIVPTKYTSVPTQHFKNQGISLIIWANHNLRASISAMQRISSQIFQEESLYNVEKEKNIVSVNEVSRLQNVEELELAEQKYLPPSKESAVKVPIINLKKIQQSATMQAQKTSSSSNQILPKQISSSSSFTIVNPTSNQN